MITSLALVSISALPSISHAAPQILITHEAAAADDQLGIAVSGIGRVDDDGFPDYAIGASLDDTGGQSAGRVLLFPGGSALSATPIQEFIGVPGELFGDQVAGVGDVTGDGYPDVLVGAFRSDEAGADAGKAYLFAGGPGLDDVPDLEIRGEDAGDRFGEALSPAGDLNDDGELDFAVGAPRRGAGAVYVYFGGADLDTIPDLVLTGETDGDRFGVSIASGGDLNGDGDDDLVVGATRYSIGAVWRGAAYVFLGGALLDTIPDLTLRGEAAGEEFGTSLAGAGDATGDLSHDLLVGAPFVNVGASTDAGRAYLFAGGAQLDTIPELSIDGGAAGSRLGTSVSFVKDVDGDGDGDLVVGAPGNPTNGANCGRVLILRGGLALDDVADWDFYGSATMDNLGWSVAGAGDPNLNTFGDVLVGAYGAGLGGEAMVIGEMAPTVGVVSAVSPADIHVAVRNPIRAGRHVELVMDRRDVVESVLFDVSGRIVAHWPQQRLDAGRHRLPLSPGVRVSAGVYFLDLRLGEVQLRRRVVVLP